MDWNRVEGNWKQFKGAAKEKWGKLTDDDLNVIEGRREQLEGKLQQRYGFAKYQIHKAVDEWFSTLKCVSTFQTKAPARCRGFLFGQLAHRTRLTRFGKPRSAHPREGGDPVFRVLDSRLRGNERG
ncbi:hypothetical protein BH10PSE10_BH10PSE10_05270 [soil metagenome]